jgi:hypothetical protein
MIYDKKKLESNNEDEVFGDSIKELDNLENIIKDPESVDNKYLKDFLSLFPDNSNLKNEIIILSKYFEIENINLEIVEDKITVLININTYLKEINNIIFFFEKMEIKQTEFIEQLKKFKDSISNLEDTRKYKVIKDILDYLKENNIYDYKDSNIHLDIYRYFYNNEIALRYLKDKDPESVKNLGERLDPMETT